MQIVIKEVESINIDSEKFTSPINNKRLIKNNIETFQYVFSNFSMALFLFCIDQIKIEIGTPNINMEESWNVIQVENSFIENKIFSY